MKFLIAPLLCASLFLCSSGLNISLSEVSTLYIPSYDSTDNAVYQFGQGTVEQIAYDPKDKIVYAVGADIFHVIDVSNPNSMQIVYHKVYTNTDLTDIEFCGDHVFFAADNATNDESRVQGTVYVLKKYQKNNAADSLRQIHRIKVGTIPDMIKPTKDCRTVVVAIEAEAFGSGTAFQDPLGGVGIIKFPNGVEQPNTYTALHFTAFNDRFTELEKQGVRFVYRENNNTFDRDVEPEYITYNTDESIAYIGLQENNAIAEVNLKTETITAIHGLGAKSWNATKLDPSDKDDGIHLSSYDIKSFYLPDAIHFHTWMDSSIIITANEGDAKDYADLIDWDEERRGAKAAKKLSDVIPAIVKTDLKDDKKLGRLTFSKVDGLNSDGEYDTLYTYGGRGISIRSVGAGLPILYDSGGIVEEQIAQNFPDFFNSKGESEKTPKENMDSRSDSMGPRCEALETAVIGGRLIIFVGNGSPGSISIFSVGDKFSDTRYESTYFGIPQSNVTFGSMYDQRTISEIDPEDIRYVSGTDSPTNGEAIFVAGSKSGTLSILKVNIEDDRSAAGKPGSAYLLMSSLLGVICIITYIY
ncbi:mesenchyme-specific cell surface glycoprotein isoform X4 [Patella vulgata]|uniref:mesenchyme-specific cell surface glycoprotein isoform X4 n=1 Tax=Patella vulgata TaxID=6465 RepID=UPI00217FA99F|nr:mesenchyme-specific cell surface glycoprotein isoform X4 [Patella vulgata]